MTTRSPFLVRFAQPIERPMRTETEQEDAAVIAGNQVSESSGESRFTRVLHETTDDE
jgi:pyruvate/2-oxoglutarate/acetoin dehydrogenase E1 component